MPTSLHSLQANDEIISDEVKEIINYRPRWIVRNGNIVFFLVLLFLLIVTWFISYPDIINGSARLVSLNAPKMIASKSGGKLMRLFVSDGASVQKGEHLGYMENTAAYKEVMRLNDWIEQTINKTQAHNYNVLIENPLPSLFNLGELQASFQTFQNQLVETKELLASGYYQNKKMALQKGLLYLSRLKANSSEQKRLLEQDRNLQQKEYDAYESLEKDKVIAPLELNQYKSRLIAKEQSLKQINSQLTNGEIARHLQEKEIMDLEKQVMDQEQKFNSSLLNLKSEVQKWVQQFVLTAPESGKLMFTSSLQENELIELGQNLFYLQPSTSKYYAELMVAQKGFGKIKAGQRVILKAEGYPSEEYGHLNGTINYVSSMPGRRDSFLLKVTLPQSLKTNYDKEIFFRNNLLAQAQIITEERRLFTRLIGQLNTIVER
jgi:multidrug resistance efflux pump